MFVEIYYESSYLKFINLQIYKLIATKVLIRCYGLTNTPIVKSRYLIFYQCRFPTCSRIAHNGVAACGKRGALMLGQEQMLIIRTMCPRATSPLAPNRFYLSFFSFHSIFKFQFLHFVIILFRSALCHLLNF